MATMVMEGMSKVGMEEAADLTANMVVVATE